MSARPSVIEATTHALKRMAARGVTQEDIAYAIQNAYNSYLVGKDEVLKARLSSGQEIQVRRKYNVVPSLIIDVIIY